MIDKPSLSYSPPRMETWKFEQAGPWPNKWSNVHEVTAWINRRTGALDIYVNGMVLRRDGQRSRQNRTVLVADLGSPTLPNWLVEIIDDAWKRLDR